MTLLASLARRWEALAWQDGPLVPENGLAPRGAASVNVGFELVIARDGTLVEHRLLGAPHEKPPRWRVLYLPDIERTSGIAPAFLWDKTAYLLGVTNVGTDKERRAGQDKRTVAEHAAFVGAQQDRIGDDPDEGLRAMLAFLDAWSPERFEAEGLSLEYLDLNGVFRLEDDRHSDGTWRCVHERPAARALWTPSEPTPASDMPTCLIEGRPTLPARLHSKIKGVYGGQASGAPIASVNAASFRSHGWTEGAGLDAPVSPRAAHAYRTALNALLARNGDGGARIERGTTRHGARRGPRGFENKGVVGDTTVAFWAETGGGEPAEPAEAIVGAGLGQEDALAQFAAGADMWGDEDAEPDPEQIAKRRTREHKALGEAVGALADGASFDASFGRLDPNTTIHVLGLSPNEGRIALRFHHVGSLGTLAENLRRHWEAMRLSAAQDERPPSARALVRETAIHRWDTTTKRWSVAKDAAPPPRLAGELVRAILEGTRYPQTLAAAILLRVRSERGHVNARRAAILKAIFNRNHADQHGGPLMPGLDRDRLTPGYLLGQLFALYEKAENEAQAKLVEGKREKRERNATLRDRYFSAASAGPARVFPTLGNGHGHNMAKLRKRAEETFQKSHGYIEREVGRVMAGLPIDIPNTLSPPEQSEFIIGYWHMKNDRPLKSDDGNEDADENDLIEAEGPAQ